MSDKLNNMSDKKPAFVWGTIKADDLDDVKIYSVYFDDDNIVRVEKTDVLLKKIQEVKITTNEAHKIGFINIKALDEYFKSDKMWTQTTTNDTIKEDSIVEAIRTQLKDRSDVGIRKYNTTLDRTDLSLLDWLEHAKQEALDFALYLERIKREVKEKGLDG